MVFGQVGTGSVCERGTGISAANDKDGMMTSTSSSPSPLHLFLRSLLPSVRKSPEGRLRDMVVEVALDMHLARAMPANGIEKVIERETDYTQRLQLFCPVLEFLSEQIETEARGATSNEISGDDPTILFWILYKCATLLLTPLLPLPSDILDRYICTSFALLAFPRVNESQRYGKKLLSSLFFFYLLLLHFLFFDILTAFCFRRRSSYLPNPSKNQSIPLFC